MLLIQVIWKIVRQKANVKDIGDVNSDSQAAVINSVLYLHVTVQCMQQIAITCCLWKKCSHVWEEFILLCSVGNKTPLNTIESGCIFTWIQGVCNMIQCWINWNEIKYGDGSKIQRIIFVHSYLSYFWWITYFRQVTVKCVCSISRQNAHIYGYS